MFQEHKETEHTVPGICNTYQVWKEILLPEPNDDICSSLLYKMQENEKKNKN